MVRKKLDERIRTLIERSVVQNQRSILVLVGDHGKDQVPNLFQLLTRTSVRARPKVLWCYKKELGFSTHRMKRMKKLKRDKAKGLKSSSTTAENQDSTATTMDNFELFLSSTDINWCYYKDTHRVLGSTVGMLVLQDFEALTPNIMARTIETVQGGGLVIFLMRTVKSLKQLYTMSMDVHARYRTESAGDVIPRFNERFILSLGKCANCLVCDDELNVLPLSKSALRKLGESHIQKGDTGEVLTRKSNDDLLLQDLKDTLRDTPHVGCIIELAKTMDQAKAVLTFLEACSEKTTKSTVALTASRGRGKSAAIGLCLAGAISFGYSTILVTAPEPENLVAVFDFVIRGLKALKYQEHLDFSISYNTSKAGRDHIKCIIGVEVHKSHRQIIKYVKPDEPDKFSSAELVAIDEAAAIPLPTVKALMGDRLTFMSSTVNGYEGTGRALSLKLIKELREAKGRSTVTDAADSAAAAIAGPKAKKGEGKVHEERWAASAAAASDAFTNLNNGSSGPLREIELATPIRYGNDDPVETWLNKLLCLDCGNAAAMKLVGGAPAPQDCELYHVDRDALFSYHKLSESFLQKLMGLYTSAHYKNTPNDLQMLSDAPAHSVFVLLSPSAEQDSESLPDILAVVQVALEGRISRKAVEAQLSRGHRSAGDLIPWTISQQFGDSNFAQLSGARVVRVAVHPSVQGMGYGSRAMELLYRFYNGEMVSLSSNDMNETESEDDDEGDDSQESNSDSEVDGSNKKKAIQKEKLTPRKELPPLLLPLTEVEAPRLDWIGTSFGLTPELHKFWKRSGMKMLYLRQTKNDLTGEHSAIMIRALPKRTGYDDAWLPAFSIDSKRRIISLLSGQFRDMNVALAYSLLEDVGSVSSSNKIFMENEEASVAIGKRSGTPLKRIDATELNFILTPHDIKRIDLYGRNLCDHHLVTDLLPPLARLYFTGRYGSDFTLSSVQGALLCGVGLQNKTIDEMTTELNLPPNQVLAMFNKGIRKISMTLQSIMEESEKTKLLSDDARFAAEKKAEKLGKVSYQTLDEDVKDGAQDAMAKLNENSFSQLPPEVAGDAEIMSYAIKGTDKEWEQALKDKGKNITSGSLVQVKGMSKVTKRKLNDEDIAKEAGLQQLAGDDSKKKKKKKGKK